MEEDFRKKIYILFSVLISAYLSMPKDITLGVDRGNYLVYAQSSDLIIQRYLSESIVTVLSNEPLFLLINIMLNSVFSPETVMSIIIFASTMLVLYCLGKLTKFNLTVIILFLILPQVIKNHTIHLRQGLALGFYLLGLIEIKGRKIQIFRFLSPFIHSSFFFLLFFEILDFLLKKLKFKFTVRIIFSIIFFFALIQFLPVIASVVQDRRATQYLFDMTNEGSGIGFIIWLLFSTFFILVINKNEIYTILSCYALIFYLCSYFFLDFGARIFENSIPLIMVAILNLKDINAKRFFLLFLILYGILTGV